MMVAEWLWWLYQWWWYLWCQWWQRWWQFDDDKRWWWCRGWQIVMSWWKKAMVMVNCDAKAMMMTILDNWWCQWWWQSMTIGDADVDKLFSISWNRSPRWGIGKCALSRFLLDWSAMWSQSWQCCNDHNHAMIVILSLQLSQSWQSCNALTITILQR